MRRSFILLFTLVTLVALPAGSAAASAAHKPKPKPKPKPTLQILHTHSYGDILVNGRGYVVYGFSIDKPGKDVCQGIRECLSQWPAVLPPHTLLLGRGVRRSLVGSIRLSDGTRQLTYNRWPLYTYVVDAHPGDLSNVDIFQSEGFWPAVSPKGKFVPSS